MIEHPDERKGEPVKPAQRRGHNKRRWKCPADGDGLRGQLTDHDQQVAVDEETPPGSPACPAPGRRNACNHEERPQQVWNTGWTTTPSARLASVMPS